MNDVNCIFCKIINHEVASKIFFEDEDLIILDDLHPKAPIHKLIIPKIHIKTFNEASPEALTILTTKAQQLAKELKVQDSGFRLIINCQRGGGQEIFHLHLHFLAGFIKS